LSLGRVAKGRDTGLGAGLQNWLRFFFGDGFRVRGEERTDEQDCEGEPNSPDQQQYFNHTGTFRMPEGTARLFSKHFRSVNPPVPRWPRRRIKAQAMRDTEGSAATPDCGTQARVGAGPFIFRGTGPIEEHERGDEENLDH
jgi:hypothetical protein